MINIELEKRIVEVITEDEITVRPDIIDFLKKHDPDLFSNLEFATSETFDALRSLINQEIIIAVKNTTPQVYALAGGKNDGGAKTRAKKQPKLDAPAPVQTPEEKLDYDKITELVTAGKSRSAIANTLNIGPRQFNILAEHDGPIGQKIRAALIEGESKRREAITKPMGDGLYELSTSTAKVMKETLAEIEPLESFLPEPLLPIPFQPKPPPPDPADTKFVADPNHEDRQQPIPPPPDPCPKFHVVELQNGGTVTIEYIFDLFHTTEDDRNFIDALVELVQIFENKKGSPKQ